MNFTEAARRYALLGILTLAIVFRTWGAFDHKGYFEDEALHVPAALNLGHYGIASNFNWFHPHMSHLLIYGGIKLFGDNPYGWRSKNIILGTLTILILFLIAREIFSGNRIPLLAASLLAVDPFHVYYSRTTFMEIPVSCFFLIFLLFIVKYMRTGRDYLLPAGFFLGLTIATKNYYPITIVVTIAIAMYYTYKHTETSPAQWAYLAATLLILPFCVYLLSHLPWLANGRTMTEFIQMKQDAFRTLQSLKLENFNNIEYLKAGGVPWEWFLKPKMCGSHIASFGSMGLYLLEINNPPIRMLTLPALLFCLITAWRQRSLKVALVPALFLSTYLLILLMVRRPLFSYSALVLLPFAYLMIAFTLDSIINKARNSQRAFAIVMGSIITWGVYLFPLTSVRPVPNWLYQPILSRTTIVSGTRSTEAFQ